MFMGCISLETIKLEEGLTTIDSGAFASCTAVKELVIPSSVSMINSSAFGKMTADQTIIIKGKSSAPSNWDPEWDGHCSSKIVWNG